MKIFGKNLKLLLSKSPLKRSPRYLRKSHKRSPKRIQCKVDTLPKKTIYIVYNTDTIPVNMINGHNTMTEDIVGFFTKKSDAVKVTECINNFYKDEMKNKKWADRYKYSPVGYKFGDVFFEGIRNFGDRVVNNDVYIVYNDYDSDFSKKERDVKDFYYKFRSYKDKTLYYVERLIGVTDTLEKAKRIKAEYLSEMEHYGGIHSSERIEIQKFCTNELKPFKFFKDYNRYIHEKGAKTYLQDIKQYAHKQKMKDTLENIELMRNAPPSKLLPKGGLGYREHISDPEFIKRWAPWDPKFRK